MRRQTPHPLSVVLSTQMQRFARLGSIPSGYGVSGTKCWVMNWLVDEVEDSGCSLADSKSAQLPNDLGVLEELSANQCDWDVLVLSCDGDRSPE